MVTSSRPHNLPSPPHRIGVDVGGTFTDCVLLNSSGRIRIAKVLTTADDPIRGIELGISQLLSAEAVSGDVIQDFVHGTTLITNAVIERKGVNTALLTTQGFEDVLEIGREQRCDLYDLDAPMPKPIVGRRRRFGISERTNHEGEVLIEVDRTELSRLASALIAQGVQSVAICFLHSWRNPANEVIARDVINRTAPQLSVSISADVAPEIGEYERLSTTVLNAYTKPIAAGYLGRLTASVSKLGLVKAKLAIMASNGNLTSADQASKLPIRLLESGPAGGCLAAVQYSLTAQVTDLLAFDMGGTTAKLCLILNSQPTMTNQFEAARTIPGKKRSGLPVRIPSVDLIEIGVGGGSIAGRSAVGLLKVGPTSAGSSPGPACYGLGGLEATVTDASLVLGYLGDGRILGGKIRLDRMAALSAVTRVATELGITMAEAALGIYRVANENMANAARAHILEQGKDPRHYPVFAFGGAGPLHAHHLTKLLGARTFIVPAGAGVCSAIGFLDGVVAEDRVRSATVKLPDLASDTFDAIFEEMKVDIEGQLRDAVTEVEYQRFVDMRYVGQGFEVSVPIPDGKLSSATIATQLRSDFRDRYQARYGMPSSGQDIEIISWRLVGQGAKRGGIAVENRVIAARDPFTEHAERMVMFNLADGFRPTPVLQLSSMQQGVPLLGPAIIESVDTAIVIPPLATAMLKSDGAVVVEVGVASEGQLERAS
jgi:N-methylhydantoinase A